MSRFILDNKVYDTEKMKFIAKVKKWYRNRCTSRMFEAVFGKDYGYEYDCDLYRSKKGNWLLVHNEYGETYGEAISETEAINLLKKYDYDAYIIEYGELEEA